MPFHHRSHYSQTPSQEEWQMKQKSSLIEYMCMPHLGYAEEYHCRRKNSRTIAAGYQQRLEQNYTIHLAVRRAWIDCIRSISFVVVFHRKEKKEFSLIWLVLTRARYWATSTRLASTIILCSCMRREGHMRSICFIHHRHSISIAFMVRPS